MKGKIDWWICRRVEYDDERKGQVPWIDFPIWGFGGRWEFLQRCDCEVSKLQFRPLRREML